MQPERLPSGTVIGSASPHDWTLFRKWAQQEGWRVPLRELALYRHELADSVFTLRDAESRSLGFVTICRQQHNAWIGNLIVDPERRGNGYGRRLFQHAVGCLSAKGVATMWLTASAAGRPLYGSCGFHEAGRVERWVWRGVGMAAPGAKVSGDGGLYALVRADAVAWGYSRAELLTLLARGGRIVTAGSTVALLQPSVDLHVLGPWLSADHCPRANRTVVSKILDSFSGAGEIAVDVIGRAPETRLLKAAGFWQTGETLLMMRGALGNVKFDEVVSLASLGSMG